ncbi:MAG: methyltransferase domain-containing protein [Reinekea sp.]|nr:methyltransferase domain-containing protein [Reinekea sp.]
MDATAKFWEKIADRYARQPVADEQSYQTKLAKTREYLTPDSTVLEFGCGTGTTAITHAPYVKHIHAIDIADNMLQYGREKAAKANVSNISFEQATIEEFQAPASSFDMVLGLSILHLLRDPQTAINKVFTLLKPGGVFVSSTVCIDERQRYLKYILPIMKLLGKAPFVQSFKVADVEHLLTQAGFTIDHHWLPGKGTVVFLIAKKPL